MRFLVFQHVSVEHPGSLRKFWRENDVTWDPVELDIGEPIPDLDRYDALIVMGGPMDTWQEDKHPWLQAEKAAIREWVTGRKRPFLGICLGHQLLADAVGGVVGPADAPEVGFGDVHFTPKGQSDRIFSGFDGKMETFQWHGAEVKALPGQAEVLASNENCAIQAFRYGESAYGLQFHVELTPDTVPDWKKLPEYAASLEVALGVDGAGALEAQAAPKISAFTRAARRVNDNFLDIVSKAALR